MLLMFFGHCDEKYIYITALLSTLSGTTSAHTHDFKLLKSMAWWN